LVQEFDNDTNTDSPANLSSATTLTIQLKRPDNTTVSKAGILSTDGYDGKMYIVTETDDINVEGTYYVQGRVISAGWNGYSSIGNFEVHDNL
ncbi:MAG: hypothetical protein PF450_02260, partial [Bacteroidales bacterium]|nr:hypothetical protein [Bacteroidales bacterium]